MARKAAEYTAEDIEILEDLSPILHRPGMYTDPVNPNHALVEIIDNAADEGLAGFASNVAVTLFEDGSRRSGRRRPRHPGRHPPEEEGAGGAGDLHHAAFGRQVPQDRQGCRLPHRRRPARRRRLRQQRACPSASRSTSSATAPQYRIVFADNGKVKEPLKKTGNAGAKDTGTRVRFWPDPKYFDSPRDRRRRPRRAAARQGHAAARREVHPRHREEGQDRAPDLALSRRASRATSAPRSPGRSRWRAHFFGERYIAAQSEADSFAEGEGAMWAMAWTPDGDLVTECYVNMIPTRHGGTHVAGLREARLQRRSRTSSTSTPWASAA